jgi:hypothetical protein
MDLANHIGRLGSWPIFVLTNVLGAHNVLSEQREQQPEDELLMPSEVS